MNRKLKSIRKVDYNKAGVKFNFAKGSINEIDELQFNAIKKDFSHYLSTGIFAIVDNDAKVGDAIIGLKDNVIESVKETKKEVKEKTTSIIDGIKNVFKSNPIKEAADKALKEVKEEVKEVITEVKEVVEDTITDEELNAVQKEVHNEISNDEIKTYAHNRNLTALKKEAADLDIELEDGMIKNEIASLILKRG